MNKKPYHYRRATRYNRRISMTPRTISWYSTGRMMRRVGYILGQRFK